MCPDLRGYGESSKPPTTEDHEPYSKRAMARDCVALMRALGFERFAVAGHDRGSYVAFRTAMDHPDVVTALAVLDSIPIGEALARADARFAERLVALVLLRPDLQARRARSSAATPTPGTRPGRRSWARRRSPTTGARSTTRQTVHAMFEDYRAGLGIDRAHDEADRAAGRRVACPTLIAWSIHDDLEEL